MGDASGESALLSLSSLARRIERCRRCPRLVTWREAAGTDRPARFAGEPYWARPVPGFGDAGAWLVVVGLAPAAHGANRTGRMFTGDRSGEWLYGALWRAGLASQAESTRRGDGLTLDGAWVTAAVRCAPPANKPTRDETQRCLPFLEDELALLHEARVLVALGSFAHRALASLLAVRPVPRFRHLGEHPVRGGRWLLSSYHPSQQNTFTGVLTQEMFDAVFARAKELAALAVSPPSAEA